MSAARRTYEQVHAGLHWAYGRAAEFPCVRCENQANHWCYQYSAGDSVLFSPTGAPYSEDFEDYAPMCRRCHKAFDMSMEPRLIEAVRINGLGAARRNNERAKADPEWSAERARRMQESIRKRREADPEFAEQYREAKSRAGKLGGYPSGKPWTEARRVAHAQMTADSRDRWKAGASKGGHTTKKVRRMCAECGRISTPAGMGNHLKRSGHFAFFGPVNPDLT